MPQTVKLKPTFRHFRSILLGKQMWKIGILVFWVVAQQRRAKNSNIKTYYIDVYSFFHVSHLDSTYFKYLKTFLNIRKDFHISHTKMVLLNFYNCVLVWINNENYWNRGTFSLTQLLLLSVAPKTTKKSMILTFEWSCLDTTVFLQFREWPLISNFILSRIVLPTILVFWAKTTTSVLNVCLKQSS